MADPVGCLKQIAEVALKRVETVRENKEECLRIGGRVTRVGGILSQLPNTADPVMSAAREELVETLHRAHKLVTACQENNIVCLFCTATKLSKQLRRVKKDIKERMMEANLATINNVQVHIEVHINLTLIRVDDAHPPYHCKAPPPPLPPYHCKAPPPAPAPAPAPPPPLPPYHCKAPPPPPAPAPPKDTGPESLQQARRRRPLQNAEDPAGRIPLSGLPSRYFPKKIGDTAELSVASTASAVAYEGYEISSSAAAYEGYEMTEDVAASAAPAVVCSPAYEGYEMVGEENNVPTGSEMSSPPSSSLIEFSLTQLEVATQNFSTIVGQGGFATVYKGVLRDGLVVAVKKLANVFPSSDDEEPINHPFVRLCSMLENKNIVRLLGYCHESREEHMPNEDAPTGFVQANEEFSLLVEEYIPNGTLSNVIYGSQLNWSSRFRIIQGITHGVIYLHTHSEKPIVHLDLKPDNILLDSDMNPKICGFGSARILDDHKMAIVYGTLGYMPPECIVKGVISVKNDVYGFGVTLLDIISGMRRSGPTVRHQASIEWAWNQAEVMDELFDPLLCDQSQLKEIKRCMEIGLLCTQEKPTDRPTMPDVLQMLNGKKKLPTPKLPGYIKIVLRGNVQ